MAPVIELCRQCGFDIPADAPTCPGCRPPATPTLAARQAAGLALPTRSVHELPATPMRRDRRRRPVGRARTARSAFSFTTAFALLTFAAAGLAWLAGQPRFVLQVPSGAQALLDQVVVVAATASVATLGLGLLAMLGWTVRAGIQRLTGRRVAT